MGSWLEKHSKKVNIACLSIISGCVLFIGFIPTVTDAVNSEFKDRVILQASNEINHKGEDTLEYLRTLEVPTGSTQEDVDRFIAEQQALLEQALKDYYDKVAAGKAGESDLESLKNQIISMRKNIEDSFKIEVDYLFENL